MVNCVNRTWGGDVAPLLVVGIRRYHRGAGTLL